MYEWVVEYPGSPEEYVRLLRSPMWPAYAPPTRPPRKGQAVLRGNAAPAGVAGSAGARAPASAKTRRRRRQGRGSLAALFFCRQNSKLCGVFW
jgi:hypothetical protein